MAESISTLLNNTAALPLSPLRQDLEIIANDYAKDGSPRWTLLDPIRHRFFQLNWRNFTLLQHWPSQSNTTTAEQLASQPALQEIDVTTDDVEQLERFLQTNNLAATHTKQGDDFYQQQQQGKHNWWQWLVHNYLFLKIPLVHPDEFLSKTYSSINWIYSRTTFFTFMTLAIIGLYFTAMQWSQFSSTFIHFFTPQGFVGYAIALVLIKILHELGHAYTLKHYGGRVPSIGLAFIVMLPVLYTDTSDAWRLTSRKQRLHIGAAGMMVELSIAIISTFIWAVVDDGILRSIAFFAATTSWISSLAVNLNPFMRFDGYYLLADAMNIENLQARAFAHGKAELRHRLFGLPLSGLNASLLSVHKQLVFYAWCTWVYRFFLFLGIALLVYNFFFKVLGIIVFIIEILWFILIPIMKEIKTWWSMRTTATQYRRSWISAAIIGGLFLLAIIPWSSSVDVQGILTVKDAKQAYAYTAGKVVESNIHEGKIINDGERLLLLNNPDLEQQIAIKKAELALIQSKLKTSQLAAERREETAVLSSEKNQLAADIAGLQNLLQQQVFYADESVMVRNINPYLLTGNWVTKGQHLFTLLPANAATQWQARGYIREAEYSRLQKGQTAIFYPENIEIPAIDLTLTDIAGAGSRTIEKKALTSTYGGEVAVSQTKDKGLLPEVSVHELTFTPTDNTLEIDREIRGTIRIKAERKSFLGMTLQRTGAVLRRELGI